MLGFQLLLQALFYDVQFSTRTLKVRRDPDEPATKSSGGEMFFRS
jgi:hypothetical protein